MFMFIHAFSAAEPLNLEFKRQSRSTIYVRFQRPSRSIINFSGIHLLTSWASTLLGVSFSPPIEQALEKETEKSHPLGRLAAVSPRASRSRSRLGGGGGRARKSGPAILQGAAASSVYVMIN